MKKVKSKKIFIIGSGDHANVLKSIIRTKNQKITFIDKYKSKKIRRVNLIDQKSFISKYKPTEITLINGVSFSPKNKSRLKINSYFKKNGFRFQKVISKNSIIHKTAYIGAECQILNGVIIQNNAFIGNNTIINTGSIIEHGCKIGKNCFVAPGCVVCGNVKIGDNVYVGPKTCITKEVNVGENSIIAAGSTLRKKLKSNKFYYEKRTTYQKKL